MSEINKLGLGGKESIVGETNNHKGGYWGLRGSNNNNGCISYIIIALVMLGLFLLMYFI